MDKERFEKAIDLSGELNGLESMINRFDPDRRIKLAYIESGIVCPVFSDRVIKILKKHDLIIRKEIMEAYEDVKKQIEEL